MARVLLTKCECCGRLKDDPTAQERQQGKRMSWWLLEDQGEPLKTLPLDFCSLRCLVRWLLEMKRLSDLGKLDWHKAEFQPQDEPMIADRVKGLVAQMMNPWPEATATLPEGKADGEHN